MVVYFFALNLFYASDLLCGQPGQQHGRFLPLRKSSLNLLRWSFRVSGFFTIVTQQIHSFRASGVRPFQVNKRVLCACNTSLMSFGSVCRKYAVVFFFIPTNYIKTQHCLFQNTLPCKLFRPLPRILHNHHKNKNFNHTAQEIVQPSFSNHRAGDGDDI